MSKPWGRVLLATRLGKSVPAEFVIRWTETVVALAPGDGCTMVTGMVAHKAANHAVRQLFLTDADSILFMDDDCFASPDIIAQFQELPEANDYDMVQAFYTRRGWPPVPIWIREDSLGNYVDTFIEDSDTTEEVAIVGLHCTMIRRSVFEKLLGESDPNNHEWFFYPRHATHSEDAAFCLEARAAGFRAGATTRIKVEHISELKTGWGIYNDWLDATGRRELLDRYRYLSERIAQFSGETAEHVVSMSMVAGQKIAELWHEVEPKTPDEFAQYYTLVSDLYLYDLLHWNCEPLYERITAPLKNVTHSRCLVIGAGIGGEIEALIGGYNRYNELDYIEPGGRCAEFIYNRFAGTVANRVNSPDGLYDIIVCVDVLEHLHPETLAQITSQIDAHLKDGGTLVMHYATDRHEYFPQHMNHDEAVDTWLAKSYNQVGEFAYIRRSKHA